jgi:membrane protein DedA with SNARE-associated domain
MSLSEYVVLFVLVAIMGAGLPGPGDASLIAAGIWRQRAAQYLDRAGNGYGRLDARLAGWI